MTTARTSGPRPLAILVTGTLAIDHVGEYPGSFSGLSAHDGLNACIQLARIERRFGGCAMNIAYSLAKLGEAPTPFVFVGQDFDQSYAGHLASVGIDTLGVNRLDAPMSSHGFVFTDADKNQFTAFYGCAADGVDLEAALRQLLGQRRFGHAVLAPDVPANMLAAAKVLREAGVPFLTDPGQNLTDFDLASACDLVERSTWLIVNEFEYETLRGYAGDRLLDQLELLVVTLGKRGARWHSDRFGYGSEVAVPADEVDPTGCGDAFRAGFLHAFLRGADVRTGVRAGGVTAALVLESRGTQCHDCGTFASRYEAAWGAPLDVTQPEAHNEAVPG